MAMRKDVPEMPKEEKIGGLCRWEVENDLRALRDANKIKSDPKRTSAVKQLLKEEMNALKQLAMSNKRGLGK